MTTTATATATTFATTFSAMMLSGCKAVVKEITLQQVKDELAVSAWSSAVGHETTALVLTALMQFEVKFNRANVALKKGDVLLVVTPNFRASEAREFTFDEVNKAGFRCFKVVGV